MKRIYYWSFIVLLAFYVVLTFTLPPDPEVLERYAVTGTDIKLINLSIVVPIIAIYLSALFGFMRIKDYSHAIAKTKEGPHFRELANGLMVLAFSLPVSSILSVLISYVRHHSEDWLPELTVLRGYVILTFSLWAITLIAKGSNGLLDSLKIKKDVLNSNVAILGPIILASLFTWLISSQDETTSNLRAYYLPEWMIIFSIAIPYAYAWCLGIKAAFQLYMYRNGVNGILYKKLFDNLSKGVAVVIVVSILVQLFTALTERLLSRLNLSPLLVVVYILLIMYAIGFGLVARGSKMLKKIEEA